MVLTVSYTCSLIIHWSINVVSGKLSCSVFVVVFFFFFREMKSQ